MTTIRVPLPRPFVAGLLALFAGACSEADGAAADGGGDAGPASTEPTLTFVDKPTHLGIVNGTVESPPVPPGVPVAPRPEPPSGQTGLLTSELYDDAAYTTKVGTQHGVCTTTVTGMGLEEAADPMGQIQMCQQALNIYGKGKIVFGGPQNWAAFHRNEPQTLAILGGTGVYRGARGEVRLTETAPGSNIHIYQVFLVQTAGDAP